MASVLHRHAAVFSENAPKCLSTLPAQIAQIAARILFLKCYGDICSTGKLPKLKLTKPNFPCYSRGDMCQILAECTEQDTQ